MSIIPGSASIANQVFAKFVSRLPHVRSDLHPPKTPISERMKVALHKLADIMEDPGFSSRDPMSPLSFSCLPPDIAKSQEDALIMYRKGQCRAFSPIGIDGRPPRKWVVFFYGLVGLLNPRHQRYSERWQERHWFHGERDGLSYAGTCSCHFLINSSAQPASR